MLPFKTIIKIDKRKKRALYLQISDAIVKLIKNGTLSPKSLLPGSRQMADMLMINRQTAVSAYDELESQGWVEVLPQKGTFVKEELPIIKQRRLTVLPIQNELINTFPSKEIFECRDRLNCNLVIDRGSADDRLAPINSLSSAYRTALKSCQRTRYLSNIDVFRHNQSEVVVSKYLNRTRGLQTSGDNIILTQGSQMGIYLAAHILISKGELVVIGETSYKGADDIFKYLGANLIEIGVDKNGLNIQEIEAICKKKRIKCVYVTPHHHLPTTVTLSAGRRMRLLELASEYNFHIIEDDYDFDYHYKSSPLLPLASSDEEGRVVYVGSMSKNLASGIRFGYMAARPEFILQFKRLRKIIDRYGDLVVEKAIASMIHDGEIERHLRKCLKIYRERRDYFCHLLHDKLDGKVNFEVPQGGLAVWCVFDDKIDLSKVSQIALKKGLFLSDGSIYSPQSNKLNATRLGFASLDLIEMKEAFRILVQCI